jgi:uncharacterized protein DUF4350
LKKTATYYLGILLLAASFISCNNNQTTVPSLHQSYSKEDVIPFGTYAAYHLLQQLYSDNYIITTQKKFATRWSEQVSSNYYDTTALYICVTRNLNVSTEDISSMLDYVNVGNTLFISGEEISKEFLDTVGCTLSNVEHYNNDWSDLTNTSVQMSPAVPIDSAQYGYFFLPFQDYFSKYDSTSTRVLGLNDNGMPNFILISHGKGRLYLHCAPAAFSNYFLLQRDNYKYLENLFAFTPSSFQHVYWDDYYNKHQDIAGSGGLSTLFRYPSMKWAFCLALILLLLYIIFGGKRRQRIVPVLSPMKNTTVAYTETISRLYLQKKDNKNIADKMITYFFEYIRNQFFLNTNQVNEDFIELLSRKSSVAIEITTSLFKTIAEIQQQSSVSDQQLLLLNKQIENFYKNRK